MFSQFLLNAKSEREVFLNITVLFLPRATTASEIMLNISDKNLPVRAKKADNHNLLHQQQF